MAFDGRERSVSGLINIGQNLANLGGAIARAFDTGGGSTAGQFTQLQLMNAQGKTLNSMLRRQHEKVRDTFENPTLLVATYPKLENANQFERAAAYEVERTAVDKKFREGDEYKAFVSKYSPYGEGLISATSEQEFEQKFKSAVTQGKGEDRHLVIGTSGVLNFEKEFKITEAEDGTPRILMSKAEEDTFGKTIAATTDIIISTYDPEAIEDIYAKNTVVNLRAESNQSNDELGVFTQLEANKDRIPTATYTSLLDSMGRKYLTIERSKLGRVSHMFTKGLQDLQTNLKTVIETFDSASEDSIVNLGVLQRTGSKIFGNAIVTLDKWRMRNLSKAPYMTNVYPDGELTQMVEDKYKEELAYITSERTRYFAAIDNAAEKGDAATRQRTVDEQASRFQAIERAGIELLWRKKVARYQTDRMAMLTAMPTGTLEKAITLVIMNKEGNLFSKSIQEGTDDAFATVGINQVKQIGVGLEELVTNTGASDLMVARQVKSSLLIKQNLKGLNNIWAMLQNVKAKKKAGTLVGEEYHTAFNSVMITVGSSYLELNWQMKNNNEIFESEAFANMRKDNTVITDLITMHGQFRRVLLDATVLTDTQTDSKQTPEILLDEWQRQYADAKERLPALETAIRNSFKYGIKQWRDDPDTEEPNPRAKGRQQIRKEESFSVRSLLEMLGDNPWAKIWIKSIDEKEAAKVKQPQDTPSK